MPNYYGPPTSDLLTGTDPHDEQAFSYRLDFRDYLRGLQTSGPLHASPERRVPLVLFQPYNLCGVGSAARLGIHIVPTEPYTLIYHPDPSRRRAVKIFDELERRDESDLHPPRGETVQIKGVRFTEIVDFAATSRGPQITRSRPLDDFELLVTPDVPDNYLCVGYRFVMKWFSSPIALESCQWWQRASVNLLRLDVAIPSAMPVFCDQPEVPMAPSVSA